MTTYNKLLSYFKNLDSALVAFSGGVDSTLLLKMLKDSSIRHCAVTISSEFITDEEIASVKRLAEMIAVKHITKEIKLLQHSQIKKNPKDRCYYCKRVIFESLNEIAQTEGFEKVLDGTNIDDLTQWRPGIRALKELNIFSPFVELKITKGEIIELSKSLNLPTWNKQSSPCLATRFYYNTEIEKSYIEKVSLTEIWLKNEGFTNVRVRTNGIDATIEVDKSQIIRITDSKIHTQLINYFKKIGFRLIKLDLEGYSSGKLDKF